MNILIAGASGFIGHELVNALKHKHQITTLGRNKSVLLREFPKNITCCTWNDKIKKQLIDSRVGTCEMLTHWMIKNQAKPRFICANAVGIYGVQANTDSSAFDENSPIDFNNPHDFLSEIGIRWQMALQPAIDYGIPVISTRFGVVLKKGQGMLKKLFLSFYLGLGSIIGDGSQCISWVHIDDVVGGIEFILNNPTLTGAFNLTSPNPVSQAQFAHKLAHCLHRPLFLKMPAFFIRLLFGEMGDCLLLKGQRVLPKRILEAGYLFKYPQLDQALQHEFNI
jgi:uncharacterized protein